MRRLDWELFVPGVVIGLSLAGSVFVLVMVLYFLTSTYRCVVFDDPAAPDLGHAYTCTITHHKGGVSVSAKEEGK